MAYTLGTSAAEQERLLWQSKAYGDLATLAFKPGDTVVECGCGVGANLWIIPHFSIGQYIGFDISEDQVTRARQMAQQLQIQNANFFCGDAFDKRTLKPNMADAVLVRLVLIHLKDPEKVLRNLKSIVKPGGRLISIEPDSLSYSVRPNKKNLQKCWEKRCEFAYGPERGSIDIAGRLGKLFINAGIPNTRIRPHFIEVQGIEKDRMSHFLNGWLVMIHSVSQQLLERRLITEQELNDANTESKAIDKQTFLRQKLIICEGLIV